MQFEVKGRRWSLRGRWWRLRGCSLGLRDEGGG